jgi:hypothetical protein
VRWPASPALAPGAEIIDPAARYGDTAQWQHDWPRLVPQLTAVVVFGDRGRTVGTGCIHELSDAWWHGVPVATLDVDGGCRQVVGLQVFSERVRTAWRAGALVPGRQLVLADVLRGR